MAVLILYGDVKALDWRIWKGLTTVMAATTMEIWRGKFGQKSRQLHFGSSTSVVFSLWERERMYVAGLSLSEWGVNKYYCSGENAGWQRFDKSFEGLVTDELALGFKSSNKQLCSMIIKVELQCGNYTTMRDGDISKLAEISTASCKLLQNQLTCFKNLWIHSIS